MQVRVLGPTELVGGDGRTVGLGGAKERSLLAVLALHANQVVSEDRLVDALWEDEPPRTAIRTIQSYLSRLRRALAEAGAARDEVLGLQGAGWVLRLAPGQFDVSWAQARASEGRALAAKGDHIGAALAFGDALRAWRGRPLEEFADSSWAVLEASRLEELRQSIVEERIDAELACGRHAEIAGELEALARAHPLRERLWGQWMLALYRAGRQAEALRAYQDLRQTLGEELGIEPSPTLARLEHAILMHDPALDATTATAPPPAPTASSGVVAVLFTDIVSSTDLLQRLGDDAYEDLRRRHFAALRDVVTGADGTQVKNLGDGLMAVFASVVDAVSCATTMQREVARHNRRAPDREMQIRVGVHAGEAFRDEDDFFGTPVVIARRLCDHAQGGEILVSRLVADLVGSRGNFELTEFRDVTLKGVGTPVSACAIRWSSTATRPLPPALTALREQRFVGRDAERDEIALVWKRARASERQVVLVAGEPGIGKTTLAVEAAASAAADGALVLFGRCDEESVVAFQPFVEALTHYVNNAAPADLRRQLGNQAPDLALLIPAVGARLSEIGSISGTGAETERYRIFEAVAALISAITADGPLVLVLDDLHWADRPTLQLLNHVIRACPMSDLLILGTYRDTDLVRTHPMAETLVALRRAELINRIVLRGLAAADVERMVSGGNTPDAADGALARALWQETEGSPLFLREILRHLTESDAVSRDGSGRYRAQRRLEQLGIPEGVKEVIGRRLARLSDDANTALRIGAVIGREIRLDVLERITDLGSEHLLDALDEATAAGVIAEVGGGDGRWAFTHALVRETLYEELSLTRRVRLHQRVGEAIEAIHVDDIAPQLAQLAYHFTQAAVAVGADKAIDYARRAGEHALTLAAFEEAIRHFAMAVEVAEDASRGRLEIADLLLAQARAEWLTGDSRLARRTYERCVPLVAEEPLLRARTALGYAGATIRVFWVDAGGFNARAAELLEGALGALADEDSTMRARVLACLAQTSQFSIDVDHQWRARLSDDALAMARRLNEPATLGYVLWSRNLAFWSPRTANERKQNSEEMLQLAATCGDEQLDSAGRGHLAATLQELRDPGFTAAYAGLVRIVEERKDPINREIIAITDGCLAIVEGRFADAEAQLLDAFQRGQEIGDINGVVLFAMGMSFLRYAQGRSAELLAIGPPVAAYFPYFRTTVDGAMCFAHAAVGRDEEARAILAELDPASIPETPYWGVTAFGLCQAAAVLHDGRLGATMYDLFAPYADGIAGGAGVPLSSTHFCLAQAAAAGDRLDLAVEHYQAALDIHHDLGWRAAAVETGRHYAAALARRDGPSDREHALALTQATLALGAEIGMPLAVRDSERLRAQLLGEIPAEPPAAPKSRRRDRARGLVTARGRATVAHWTRGKSDDELFRRFSAPMAQRALFAAMAHSFQPARADGLVATLTFELRPNDDDGDPAASDWWTVSIKADKATAKRGRPDRSTLVIHARWPDFVRLAAGEVHPVRALLENTVDVEGEVLLAGRLPELFGAIEL